MGIGAAIARALADGNRLLLHHHTSVRDAQALRAELEPRCVGVDLVSANLATEAGCELLRSEIATRLPALDVLVNNAGGMLERRFVGDLTWGHLTDTFALNAVSAMFLTGLCRPLLEEGSDPCVVNVTSIAIRHGSPSATAYGAAKAALDAFTRGAASELAPRIRVNAVAPGIIDTRFHERVTAPEKMREFVARTPLERTGDVGHVAATVRFLVDNNFMTGETIDCNGGLWMR